MTLSKEEEKRIRNERDEAKQMNTADEDNLAKHIKQYVELQKLLSEAIVRLYPSEKPSNFLLGIPRSGILIDVADLDWDFGRHGVGVTFESTTKVVIDIHDNFFTPDVVDIWRIEQFLESINQNVENIESRFSQLCLSGQMIRTKNTDNIYSDKFVMNAAHGS